jgi:hypothetical protein
MRGTAWLKVRKQSAESLLEKEKFTQFYASWVKTFLRHRRGLEGEITTFNLTHEGTA